MFEHSDNNSSDSSFSPPCIKCIIIVILWETNVDVPYYNKI